MEVVRSALSGVTGVTEVRVPGQDPGHESVLFQAQLVAAQKWSMQGDPIRFTLRLAAVGGDARVRVASTNSPDVVKRLQALADEARKDLGDKLTKAKGNGIRPAGRLGKDDKRLTW